jgi:hypothetical protein
MYITCRRALETSNYRMQYQFRLAAGGEALSVLRRARSNDSQGPRSSALRKVREVRIAALRTQTYSRMCRVYEVCPRLISEMFRVVSG